MATSTSYTPVPYSSLVTEPNTFGRPRQKIWGVFIIASYKEDPGTIRPLNFEYTPQKADETTPIIPNPTDGMYKESHVSDSDKLAFFKEEEILNLDYTFQPPATGPKGEEIKKVTKRGVVVKAGAVPMRMSSRPREYYINLPVYADTDVIFENGDLTFYYYNDIIKTIEWDLILLTKDINEAKDKLNDWLRKPDVSGTPARPRIGIDSVMICEIVPADTIIEL